MPNIEENEQSIDALQLHRKKSLLNDSDKANNSLTSLTPLEEMYDVLLGGELSSKIAMQGKPAADHNIPASENSEPEKIAQTVEAVKTLEPDTSKVETTSMQSQELAAKTDLATIMSDPEPNPDEPDQVVIDSKGVEILAIPKSVIESHAHTGEVVRQREEAIQRITLRWKELVVLSGYIEKEYMVLRYSIHRDIYRWAIIRRIRRKLNRALAKIQRQD